MTRHAPRGRPIDRLYLRDATRLRNLAHEVLRQIEFFENHSHQNKEDRLRFMLIHGTVLKMGLVAKRAERRDRREWEERNKL